MDRVKMYTGEPSHQSQVNIPVATIKSIYQVEHVDKKLQRLLSGNPQEHESLRSTYDRMIDRGGDRFQIKPSGLPEMQHLYAELPNFGEPLDDIKRNVALSQDSQDGLEITPMLLLGPPGVGKTHFAKQVADLLGTGMTVASMNSLTAGWILSGSNSQWRGAKPGKVFETLVEGQYANPVIIVDEIDKAAAGAQFDPLGSLYSLLEHDTAKNFTDEFSEIAIDTSQVIWVATANSTQGIPDPILNRMNVYEITAPTPDEAREIGKRLYVQILGEHDWGSRFDPEPPSDILDMLSSIVPREMRRALMAAFGNAKLASRFTISPSDFPKRGSSKSRIGFIQ